MNPSKRNLRSFIALFLCGLFIFSLVGKAQADNRQHPSRRAVLLAQDGPVPGLTLTPGSAEKWDRPGALVTYSLTLTNTGSAADSFSISVSGNTWNSWAEPATISELASGSAATITVYVAIPDEASTGAADTASVTATSQTDPQPGASSTLQTRAVPPTPTPTTPPTASPTTSAPTNRPLVVIDSYNAGGEIKAGQEFNLDLTLTNNGLAKASNVIITFEGGGFLPRDTGGVIAISGISAGKKASLTQPMLAGPDLGSGAAPMSVKLSYTGPDGTAYAESFTLAIGVKGVVYSGAAAPTASPTMQPRAQIVVKSYKIDIDPLQPGSTFILELEIENLGSANAHATTMVLGGASGLDISSGTPTPGGMSGGGSELANFAPLGSSNLVFLGDIQPGQNLQSAQKLIVNVTTQPGAYPLKLSFVYNDPKGNRLIDDQVITLLVYQLPQIEVNYYRDPGMFMAGQPGSLPLQVTNLGRKTAVLGNLKVTADNAELSNNVSLVGNLESGGYFTLDVMFTPTQAGPHDLNVTINYTDDFNQPRSISQTLSVDVQEAPPMDPGVTGMGEPMIMEPEPETFWQKVGRFIRGLLGLGSGAPQPEPLPEKPVENAPGIKPMIGPGG